MIKYSKEQLVIVLNATLATLKNAETASLNDCIQDLIYHCNKMLRAEHLIQEIRDLEFDLIDLKHDLSCKEHELSNIESKLKSL